MRSLDAATQGGLEPDLLPSAPKLVACRRPRCAYPTAVSEGVVGGALPRSLATQGSGKKLREESAAWSV